MNCVPLPVLASVIFRTGVPGICRKQESQAVALCDQPSSTSYGWMTRPHPSYHCLR